MPTTKADPDLDRRLAALTPEQRKLLLLRLGREGKGGGKEAGGRPAPAAIPRLEERGSFPLSFAQQRLWFLDQLEPGSARYNLPEAIDIGGPLNEGALARSLLEIVRRHEALRTRFVLAGEEPVQVVAPEVELPLPRIDLSGLPGEGRRAELDRLSAEQARLPFALDRGPLLRAMLVRLGEGEHALRLVMHHIVSDGWSAGVLAREIVPLYEAFAAGEPSPLAPLAVQYPDFAVWQRSTLQGETLEEQLGAWRQRLAGLAEPLILPPDRPRPAVRSLAGARLSLALPAPLAAALRDLARREGASLFMVLLAAFDLLLQRLTGRDDVAVGSPIANRRRPELEGLIGFFVNTLVMRVDLAGDPTFRELLGRVRQTALDAFAAQDVPFERLVEELRPQRDLARNPFFEVLFNLLNTPARVLETRGLTFRFPAPASPESRFPLTLYAEERGSELEFVAVYQRDLYSAERIEALLRQLRFLLEQAAADPGRPLSVYSLVDAASRPLLPDPAAPLPEPRVPTVPERIAVCAATAPGDPAVRQGERVWTYAELATASRAVARALAARGLSPGSVVAVAGPRCFGLIAAMAGVLASGGVLLTLDRNLPVRRREVMLRESGARFGLIVKGALSGEAFPADLTAFTILGVEAGSGVPDGDPGAATAPPPLPGPDDPAYVFFTSGSTGVPKGVLGCHKGLGHFLAWQRTAFRVGPGDRVGQLTALSFDVVMRDIFLALTSGATLCLPEAEDDLGADRVLPWLARQEVTTLHCVPSVAITWLAPDAPQVPLPSLARVFFAGEPLTEDLVRRWRRRFPGGAEIVNLYGPTETTLAKFSFRVPAEPLPDVQPVGSALPQTQGLVLAEGDRLCGLGEPGEIVLRTPFRTLGYLNAGETAEEDRRRFAPNPFRPGDPADLVYRTGDLGRYRMDGVLEILGRRDQQVKIRGVRIELAEIEAELGLHPDVQQAVVAALAGEAGEKRLVAWLIGQVDPGALRAWLRDRLPEAMVPAAFVRLESLPKLPNGKVDRAALPVPEPVAETAAEWAAPQGAVQELLAEVWSGVLGVARVGAHDDFFALGGHSLLATRVVSRVRVLFGVEIALRRLFEAPTIAGLAAVVEEAQRQRQGIHLPPLVPAPRDAEIPLSFAQERMWLLNQLDAGTSAYNTGRAVRLAGRLDIGVLARCLNELVRRHESLRTTFATVDGRPRQQVRPPAVVPLPSIDLSTLPDRQAEALRRASAEMETPFDLARGPVLRTALLHLEDAEHVLLLSIHHIASDGWSFRVLVREMVALYEAFAAGRPSPLPELAVQYPDFAVWQRRALAGETLEAETSWWRRQLGGNPPPLLLPADRRRGSIQGFQPAGESLLLEPELVAALQALSRRCSASLYMTLLACWKGLLARLTGEEDVLVGAPIANRNHAEVEGLIGFFLNTLVLRTRLAGNPELRELLARVRETALGAFAHQDLPLETVLQAAWPEREVRDLARSSPFQVMFLLQNLPPQELAVAGLRFSLLATEETVGDLGTALFEVGLTLQDAEDGRGMIAAVTYNGQLFDRATIARLLARYRRLLAAAASDPDRRLWDFDLLEASERAELLAWGGPPPTAAAFVPVHRAFGERAARAPEAIAVIARERQLTYGELDRRSNQVAHRLRELGVGPECAVGIAVERSVELLVALFGVLKAGGVCVPLDPSYPAERLSYIREDAGVEVMLDTATIAEIGESGETGEIEVGPDNLAYLIYTSGSTGRPKGVMVRHGSLANYVTAFRDEHGLSPADRVLQFSALSFDTSAEEIYPCLTSGATLVLRDDSVLGSPAEFLRACGEQGITMLDLPTAFWHGLVAGLESEPTALPSALRLVIIGGERALPERVAAWHALGNGARLVNTYGPTETTIVATRGALEPGAAVAGEVPIGRPVPGASARVVDPEARLAPTGVPGELWVGGAGVARGYRGRADLTAERFVPDPWSAEPGARAYRTGDLVRWLASGDLEFLGRVDDQVKIRGFRVELREIEAALLEHPRVAAAVVAARERGAGDRRLEAFVVPREAAPTSTELRAFLRERLPDYMVPAVFATLAALPLTPSGKVDRRAVSAAAAETAARADEGKAFVAPRTTAEETVAAVWGEVLGLARVGATDHFFELGGHSLLLPQVLHRLRVAFQVEVPLRLLFDEPTVEGLALAVEEIVIGEIERQMEQGEPI
ncbi:MAG TPA: amino acid adenylation domain-containing protein [Thermoanaerobaculia bacterium]|nr:amino acid adenylation domain-containing protein [Thermoanaerobaculia bacterium]